MKDGPQVLVVVDPLLQDVLDGIRQDLMVRLRHACIADLDTLIMLIMLTWNV